MMTWHRTPPPTPGDYPVYVRPHIWLAHWTGDHWEAGTATLTEVSHWHPLPDPPPKTLGRRLGDRLLGRKARRERTLRVLEET